MNDSKREKGFHVRISIATKIVIHVSVLVFIAMSVSTYTSVKEETKVLTDSSIRIAKLQTRQIASSTKSAFWSLNWIFVENLLQETQRKYPDEIIFAKVVKPNGEVYLANDRAYYGEIIESPLLQEKEAVIENFSFPEQGDTGALIVHPAAIGDETWYVLVGLSLQTVDRTVKELFVRNILWGGLVLFFAIILSLFQAKSITGPLIELTQWAQVVSAGNLDQPVVVRSRDEVGLLAYAFGQMIRNLQNALTDLETSEYRNRVLVETASEAKLGIFVIQRNEKGRWTFRYANQHAVDLSGYRMDEVLEISLDDVLHPDFFNILNGSDFSSSNSDGLPKKPLQLKIVKRNGEELPIEVSTSATDFEGRRALVCYVKDITKQLAFEEKLKRYSDDLEKMVEERTSELRAAIVDLQMAQAQLVQSEKLASIGQLAAGIAHEINTPIQYVGDNTRFFEETFEDINGVFEALLNYLEHAGFDEIQAEQVNRIISAMEKADLEYIRKEIPVAISQTLEGVRRVSDIVRSMKEFSHPGTVDKTPIDLNRSIENTVTVSRNEWKYVAELALDLTPDLPPVPCLPGELNQVLLNMIVNAAHAIEEIKGEESGRKGLIRISTAKNNGVVEIRISDTGGGIPEEVRPRIFDPFFTTKEVGKGTGQGLAISRSVIVEKHGGRLEFETELGKGTVFIIHLPLAG